MTLWFMGGGVQGENPSIIQLLLWFRQVHLQRHTLLGYPALWNATSVRNCRFRPHLKHSVYSFYAPVAWALRRFPHIYHVSHRKLAKPTSLPCFPRDVIQPQQDTKAYLFLCMTGYCFYLLFLYYTGLGSFSLKDSPWFSMFVSV